MTNTSPSGMAPCACPSELGSAEVLGAALHTFIAGIPAALAAAAAAGYSATKAALWSALVAAAAALAGGMLRLLADQPLRDQLAHEGRRTARERFDYRTNAQQVLAIYRDLLTRGGRGLGPPARTEPASHSAAG